MKMLIVSAPSGHQDTVSAMLESDNIGNLHWLSMPTDTEFTLTCTVATEHLQPVLDGLQRFLDSTPESSIHVINIESSYPKSAIDQPQPGLTRWELKQIAEVGSKSDAWFYVLVGLSTLVAAFGLVRDNVAVVIGAMVIAPLLSPNLSFALATSLGEHKTAAKAFGTLLVGTAISFVIAAFMGSIWQAFPIGPELISRTQIHFDSALLAVAAGSAAVLSLTRGISSVLVGVMVAVALIPPLATAGLFIGRGLMGSGLSALLLFAINVASINLAAHLTFAAVGVAPRTALLASTAKRRTVGYIVLWSLLLGVLMWNA